MYKTPMKHLDTDSAPARQALDHLDLLQENFEACHNGLPKLLTSNQEQVETLTSYTIQQIQKVFFPIIYVSAWMMLLGEVGSSCTVQNMILHKLEVVVLLFKCL